MKSSTHRNMEDVIHFVILKGDWLHLSMFVYKMHLPMKMNINWRIWPVHEIAVCFASVDLKSLTWKQKRTLAECKWLILKAVVSLEQQKCISNFTSKTFPFLMTQHTCKGEMISAIDYSYRHTLRRKRFGAFACYARLYGNIIVSLTVDQEKSSFKEWIFTFSFII